MVENLILKKSIKRISKMINQELDIIDIGGESTRPGSKLYLQNRMAKS